jgi:tetratricopeptide (TPR) repeat protein
MNEINEQLIEFDRAIELKPDDKVAYFRRGSLKATKLEDDSGALVNLDRAIELNSDCADSYCNRGLLKTL